MADWRCNHCGHEWDSDPRLRVPCPVCGAPVGQHCKRPSGHQGPFVHPHAERIDLSVAAGNQCQCPISARALVMRVDPLREPDATDEWVRRVNALARKIEEVAGNLHPSVWGEQLRDLHERYRRLAAGGPKPAVTAQQPASGCRQLSLFEERIV